MRAPGGLLDRYVGLKFLGTYGICMLVFVSLFLVVDLTGDLGDISKAKSALDEENRSIFGLLLTLYVTKLPFIVTMVGPYISLLAGIATVITLSRNNELTPMVVAGRSMHRVFLPMYVLAGVLVVGLVAMEEWVVPQVHSTHALAERDLEQRGNRPIEVDHLRDGANAWYAAGWQARTMTLVNVACFRFQDPSGRLPAGRLTARKLEYRVHPHTGIVGWYPRNGRLDPASLDAESRPRMPLDLPVGQQIPLDLTPDEIDIIATKNDPKLPRGQLLALIDRYPSTPSYHMELHTRISRPFSSLVLLMLGFPIVSRLRRRTVAQGLGVALIVCIVYAPTEVFVQELGGRGAVGPLLAAWFTPALFGAVALARLDSIRT